MFVAVTIYSCKKDTSTDYENLQKELSETSTAAIVRAKDAFINQSVDNRVQLTGKSLLSDSLLNHRTLLWSKAYTKISGDTVFVFIPVKIPVTLNVAKGDLAGTRLTDNLFLRMIDYGNGFTPKLTEMVSMIPDDSSGWNITQKFSGLLLLENWYSPFSSFIQVSKGQEVAQSNKTISNGAATTEGYFDCKTIGVTQCVGVEGYMVCETHTVTTCQGGGGGGGGGTGGGGSGGGGLPPRGDGPGGGGGSGTGKKVTIANNARDCVKNISSMIESKASNMFSCIGDIAGMTNVVSSVAIGQLYASSSYNITISEAVIPNTTGIDASGNDVLTITNGSTSPITGNITLNSNVLNDATDLGVAATMIHELMHSYFIYGIKHTTGSEKFFFQDMNQYLYDDQSYPITEQYDVAQHEQMASTYVNSMGSLLQAYAIERGILSSPDSSIDLATYCKDIIWRNLSMSQSKIKAPNAARAKANGAREANNQSGTNKKGC
ncbi:MULTISPECIES: hypothetical protein [unclassified Pedobacter]|uniref:hypothetical protein n=1 Tax=Pedobacter TaxID=84567 RepID=UPI00224863A5|nr:MULTISPECIES: hypothetical protein [unclassified Pedobacter]MCX2430539.1 hypothetical protein [Pedobacter sp. GR22-10]MCX2585239.1 hypothetical protein [Pedobacter sp. MR22-3]